MRNTLFSQPIPRPPELIWGFLSDLRNDTRWRREIKAVEILSGEPGGAPATYRETVEWEGLRAQPVLTVTESIPGSRLVVVTDDPRYRSKSSWTFEQYGGVGSLVSLAFSLETTGALHLIEPLIWDTITRWLEADLPCLEGHLAGIAQSLSVS